MIETTMADWKLLIGFSSESISIPDCRPSGAAAPAGFLTKMLSHQLCWLFSQKTCSLWKSSWSHVSYVLISTASCVLSLSSVFFPVFPSLLLHVCLPLSVCIVSPVFSPLCYPVIISPAVPPHLFLVSSLVSVYIISAFPFFFLCQFVVGVWVMPPSSFLCFLLWLQSPILDFDFSFFSMSDLNFAFLLYFVLVLVSCLVLVFFFLVWCVGVFTFWLIMLTVCSPLSCPPKPAFGSTSLHLQFSSPPHYARWVVFQHFLHFLVNNEWILMKIIVFKWLV